ncbi:hypothetical protein LTR66_010746 [Elasticomyces elasticus]|nr:hypothetical protein LTR66_010746 [Elasticomyces elasticus]
MGNEADSIPLTRIRHPSEATETLPSRPPTPESKTPDATAATPLLTEDLLQAPLRAQNPDSIVGTGGPPAPDTLPSPHISPLIRQDPPPLSRAQRWAALINVHLDTIVYSAFFVLIGFPVYYALDYAMPIQLTLNVLCFFTALSLPARWKRYLHPVIISSGLTIIGIWILALMHRQSLDDGLRPYKTGTRYTQLWSRRRGLQKPGAGDVFGSILDVSIVALALPMFQYRNELKNNFFAIVIPSISISIGSLFGYPAICYAIGISATRSLSFASRSLTLALAAPATANLGGDANLVAVIAIMSGIMGVLVGPWALKTMKIPEDDYITRGVTLGANSSAVATALLLATDPRAAAFSSLSMGLFGTITVAFTSIPPLVTIIRGMVGLQ